MSKKSWYKRSHQFTPYTKADGQAVSDEFDSIQASFERIPEMRDDGTGFAVSPIIPKPTKPNHPVTLEMLTATEKSVNNSRDDVTAKAQQVAQNAQSVATNTQTAIDKANSASQSASSALSSQQSADNSENMARKWASEDEDKVVAGNKYSAYHYAMKAGKSAQNLSIAERSAKDNAQIAIQKAEEARVSAKKAESLAVGEVDYKKILNVPSASLTTKGVVQLTSDTNLDDETRGLTALAGALLSRAIEAVRKSLGNYIPNSKKSNAVNSNSTDNVATSVAVKTAYDKGVEAKTAADNAQRTANDGVSKANAANNNANGRVSKAGDTLTGILRTAGIASKHFGHGAYSNQYTSGAPFMVDNTGSVPNDTYHPFIKGETRQKNNWGAVFSLGYTTKQGGGNGFGRGIINLIEDNGKNLNWAFEHDGAFVSAGDVKTSGGKSLNSAAQLSDFIYQKVGNFEIRKYPDGTMIQTCRFNPPNNRVGAQDKKFTFNWAVAFAEKPKIFIQHQNHERSGYGSLDMVMNTIEHETTNSQVAFWVWEWYYNNSLISFDFLAIGRWKQ